MLKFTIFGIKKEFKIKLIAAKIIACEKVEKSDKLLKETLDVGNGITKTVCSGIAKYYKPEELIGKKLILVANLAPAKLCGVESEGMLLASGEETVRVIFLDPETPLGERVR